MDPRMDQQQHGLTAAGGRREARTLEDLFHDHGVQIATIGKMTEMRFTVSTLVNLTEGQVDNMLTILEKQHVDLLVGERFGILSAVSAEKKRREVHLERQRLELLTESERKRKVEEVAQEDELKRQRLNTAENYHERMLQPHEKLAAQTVKISDEVEDIMVSWKDQFERFVHYFRQCKCHLFVKNGVPLDHTGRPSILLDRLSERWTSDMDDLWENSRDESKGGVVPVIGVSGCGKTRFLYELLASRWGFFFTAKTKGNGGSNDIYFVSDHRVDSLDKRSNHMQAMDQTRCAVLARLLILDFVLGEIPDLSPHQWLVLQVQFRVFLQGPLLLLDCDPFRSLTMKLARIRSPDLINDKLLFMWERLEVRLHSKIITVLDEAQVLGSINQGQYASPETKELRSIFSPVVKALVHPSRGWTERRVYVAGTGVSFLTLESDIGSVIAKQGGGGTLKFFSAPFSRWEEVEQVLYFCRYYLKLDAGSEICNALYLLEKFRGRRRCLVSCVERLLIQCNGFWSKEVVDCFFREITGQSNDTTSIYYAVQSLCESKGTFVLFGRQFFAEKLIQRLGTAIAYAGNLPFIVTSPSDMTLLERGLGQLRAGVGNSHTFEIYEPTVHSSILNYLSVTDSFEEELQMQMVDMRDNASAMGMLWEKLVTVHIAKLFDGTKYLAEMCCFEASSLPQVFTTGAPRIVGGSIGVYRESYSQRTLTSYLEAEEDARQPFLIFANNSGPDVFFMLGLGNLRIPVFCQLKLRKKFVWGNSLATTDVNYMYKGSKYEASKASVVQACSSGYISLVIGYPSEKPKQLTSRCVGHRVVGYVGKVEAETLFGRKLCQFLSLLKTDLTSGSDRLTKLEKEEAAVQIQAETAEAQLEFRDKV